MTVEQKDQLLDQILEINFDGIKDLYELTKVKTTMGEDKISPISYVDKSKLSKEEYEELEELGVNEIKQGKLAAVTMAGGQGTRLGYDGPKGTFDIGLDTHQSLFELICETLKEAKKKYDVFVPWYIMTSHENHQRTVEFFEKNKYFGYPKNEVMFFMQGEIPTISMEGKILVNEKGFPRLAADGHGGVFESMLQSGALDDMKKRKVEWVFVGPVDNPLVNMVYEILVGLAKSKKCMAAGKSVVKARPEERVGVFCTRNGKPSVVEYSEISEEMAEATNENGGLVYGESHILCNLFSVKAIEEISKNTLPYHSAFKKNSYIDESGKEIIPTEPNSYKFESFIFDAFEFFDDIAILRGKREDDFAPVKNKDGVDSPKTAKELYEKYWNKMKK